MTHENIALAAKQFAAYPEDTAAFAARYGYSVMEAAKAISAARNAFGYCGRNATAAFVARMWSLFPSELFALRHSMPTLPEESATHV